MTVVFEDPGQPRQTIGLDLKTGARRSIVAGTSAHLLVPGHLVYASDSALNAVAFDPATASVTGKLIPIPALEIAVAADNGAANFAVSETGTLITAPDPWTQRGDR